MLFCVLVERLERGVVGVVAERRVELDTGEAVVFDQIDGFAERAGSTRIDCGERNDEVRVLAVEFGEFSMLRGDWLCEQKSAGFFRRGSYGRPPTRHLVRACPW